MLVVADTTPLVALVNIGHIAILERLFGAVIIPPAVADELAGALRPIAVRDFIRNRPPWLTVRKPADAQSIPKLHLGENEAIHLAIELSADALLIDDRAGWNAARERGLTTIRTAALLAEAADRDLLNLRQAFDRLRETDFRIDPKVLELLLDERADDGTR